MEIVPFSLAKKLKEKGFKEKCYKHYYPNSKDWFISPSPECGNYSSYLDAPTISQVLKWLREEKKIHIVYPFYKDKGFYYYVQRIGNAARIVSSFDDSDTCFDTAELAALAGIEYVIDNLI